MNYDNYKKYAYAIIADKGYSIDKIDLFKEELEKSMISFFECEPYNGEKVRKTIEENKEYLSRFVNECKQL